MRWIRFTTATAALTTIAWGATGCGDDGGGESAGPVATTEPAVTFAPLVRLHRRETSFPMSARYFLSKSGLEWAGGPCPYERDIAASAASRRVAGQPIMPLEVSRLGRPPGYQVRPYGPNCMDSRGEAYSTALRTRPYDTEDRPVGLAANEGFGLDILTDQQTRKPRRGEDGSLVGVPVYYAIEETAVDGRAGLRLSYWMLYGQGRKRDPELDDRLIFHEGDWERLDVLVQKDGGEQSGTKRYVPSEVRYHSDGSEALAVAWADVDLAGPGSTHPVANAERGTHTLRPGGECDDCMAWRTWRDVRDVRREPWFGYGGAWGVIGRTAASSGELGPSPFELDRLPEAP